MSRPLTTKGLEREAGMLRPPISIPDDYLLAYRLLARTRALNEAVIRQSGKMRVLSGLGQEIVSTIPLFVLAKLGILERSVKHMDHRTIYGGAAAASFVEGGTNALKDFFRNYFVRAEGGSAGRDGDVHWVYPHLRLWGLVCSDMGRSSGVAVGCGEALRRFEWNELPKEQRPVSVVFFGDGAAQQGGVHEAMNWTAASNYRRPSEELSKIDDKFLDDIARETGVIRGTPTIFILNDNGVSAFVDSSDEHGQSDLAKRASGYGTMVGVDVDGWDPEAVFAETLKAVDRAQNLESTLMVVHNFRLTGHNEAQIKRSPGSVERNDFFDVESVFGLDEEGMRAFNDAVQKEPIYHGWSTRLIDNGYATREELDAIVAEERALVLAVSEEVLKEPKVSPPSDRRDRSIFPGMAVDGAHAGEKVVGALQRVKYGEAYRRVIGELMEKDPSVVYFGEDVAGGSGGVLALIKGLWEKFGPVRVFNAPISEEAIMAVLAGYSLLGYRPIAEVEFAPFFWDGASVLAHYVAPQWFQRKIRFPFILVAPSGFVGGSGHYHEAWPERFIHPMSGIVIIAPSNAYDLIGLMRSAHAFDGPVVVLYQIAASNRPDFISEVPDAPYMIPLGKAHVLLEGTDLTLVAYGAAAVAAAKNEARELAKENIRVEVIDLRTVHPMDVETVKTSVEKTGRLVVMQEDYAPQEGDRTDGGVGFMLTARLMQEIRTWGSLLAPPYVLGAETPFVPTDLDLARDRLPYVLERTERGETYRSPKLAAKARELMVWK
ncbi:MAG: hypothetical protein HY457_01320 [Parcubacteria group bacterium]|nr:hypothetical protein [Parcubacteria group bacterium]